MNEITLSGIVGFGRLHEAVGPAVGAIASGAFSTIDDFHRLLLQRGSLTLVDALLYVPGGGETRCLSLNRFKLVRSTIVVGSSELVIFCNDFEQDASSVLAFDGTHFGIEASGGTNAGAPGARGSDGMRGDDAGALRVFVCREIASVGRMRVDVTGQRGGEGGDGATGPQGQAGAKGRDCASGALDCRAGCQSGFPGKQGGRGGDGGGGGAGGSGGQVEFAFYDRAPDATALFAFRSDAGIGGRGGRRGTGGPGGPGGPPGRTGCTWCDGRCYSGPSGPFGQDGNDGAAGADGQPGYLRTMPFGVQSLKAVLDSVWSPGHFGAAVEPSVFSMSSGLVAQPTEEDSHNTGAPVPLGISGTPESQ